MHIMLFVWQRALCRNNMQPEYMSKATLTYLLTASRPSA